MKAGGRQGRVGRELRFSLTAISGQSRTVGRTSTPPTSRKRFQQIEIREIIDISEDRVEMAGPGGQVGEVGAREGGESRPSSLPSRLGSLSMIS